MSAPPVETVPAEEIGTSASVDALRQWSHPDTEEPAEPTKPKPRKNNKRKQPKKTPELLAYSALNYIKTVLATTLATFYDSLTRARIGADPNGGSVETQKNPPSTAWTWSSYLPTVALPNTEVKKKSTAKPRSHHEVKNTSDSLINSTISFVNTRVSAMTRPADDSNNNDDTGAQWYGWKKEKQEAPPPDPVEARRFARNILAEVDRSSKRNLMVSVEPKPLPIEPVEIPEKPETIKEASSVGPEEELTSEHESESPVGPEEISAQ